MQSIAIVGRQPELSIAELECVFGSANVSVFSPDAATIDTQLVDATKLGGTIKGGKIIMQLNTSNWADAHKKVVQHYSKLWATLPGKKTVGISVYGFEPSPRQVQKVGLDIKTALKKSSVSMRLVPNEHAALSTATSHHNKLGLSPNKIELLIVVGKNKTLVAESTGAQNITALAARDQGRPKRDAFVGMLPPKLALMMVNMASPAIPFSEDSGYVPERDKATVNQLAASGSEKKDDSRATAVRILDPFCGTGVVLQEAALLGYNVYGTDLSEKMVDYATINLEWLVDKYHLSTSVKIHQGDAMNAKWESPIDAVVAETYLGQPFSAPPSPEKLKEVSRNCEHIITTFLKNIHGQLPPNTPLCLAVPAWRDKSGRFTHLPLTKNIEKYGYKQLSLKNVSSSELLYFREDQVVARELLLITKY